METISVLGLKVPEQVLRKIETAKANGESKQLHYPACSIDLRNGKSGNLEGYDCKICKNKGIIWFLSENGEVCARPCKCMKTRRIRRNLENSGLSELLQENTFKTWISETDWQKSLYQSALDYANAENPSGWFFVGGRSGSGKTHICTAICGRLLKRGFTVQYMLWRDAAVSAKASVTDDSVYQGIVQPLKTVPVLYIDDLFKTGKVRSESGKRIPADPTVGDVNFAFEIINARYNNPKLLTIISSEMWIEGIFDVDEAIGSRILQRARSHMFDLSDAENWRRTH